MSYDLYLKDRVSGEVINLPFNHCMTGGMYRAQFENGQFSPMPTSEAWLNITFNYAKYYQEGAEGDNRFKVNGKNVGIKALNGKTGLESINMLDILIINIKHKYPKLECSDDYWEARPGNAIKPLYQLKTMAELRPDGVWEVQY